MKTKFIAEMVGTMVLVLMGCGAAVLNGGATSIAAVLTLLSRSVCRWWQWRTQSVLFRAAISIRPSPSAFG